MMDFSTKECGDITVIALQGELNAISTISAERIVRQMIDKGKIKIILNLEGVSYLSSAGVRFFISFYKELTELNGKLCICCLTDNVKDVIRIAGIDQIMPVYTSEKECFSRF